MVSGLRTLRVIGPCGGRTVGAVTIITGDLPVPDLMRKIAITLLAIAFCSPAFGASEQYAKVGPWNIAYSVLDNGTAYCLARIDYPDHAFMVIESFTKQPQPAFGKIMDRGLTSPELGTLDRGGQGIFPFDPDSNYTVELASFRRRGDGFYPRSQRFRIVSKGD
jgi:hypothetical protein